MSNILISLIIPVYNVEAYVEQCLKSVLYTKNENFEILIIDDASTDDSLQIINKFDKQDARIKVTRLRKNRGSGAVRNLGLKKAIGKYVWFIDSDDWIEKNALQELFDYVSETSCDIVYFGTQKMGSKKKIVFPKFEKHYPNFFKDGLKTLKGIHPMVWCSIFSRSFLFKNKILFPKGIYFEDVPFSLQAQYYCKDVGVIKKSLYNYRIHDDSITQSTSKKKIDDSFTAHFMIKDFLEKKGEFETFKEDFIIRLLSCCIVPCFVDYFKMSISKRDKELRVFMKQVRKSDLLSFQNLVLLKEIAIELDQFKPNDGRFFKKAYNFLIGIRYTYGFVYFLLSFKRLLKKVNLNT